MKTFTIKAQFIFEGTFKVKAEDEAEARRMITDDTGLCLGGNIHTNCNDEDIDWNFDVHSEKKILGISEILNPKAITKKEFKERCYFGVYTAPGKRVNAIFYDWKEGFGYKYRISTDVKNASKAELFNDFYAWVTGTLTQPYYYEGYKFAETDAQRFKVPLGGL
jgi:hypothetical protein